MEKQLKDEIIKLLEEKKAIDIETVYIADKSSIADYLIIATARSTTQIKALCEYLEEMLEEQGVTALRKDIKRDSHWAVVDYGSILVHIFAEEERNLFNLSELWNKR